MMIACRFVSLEHKMMIAMTMCLSISQDDDSMMIVFIEKHGISRVKGACARAVLKGRAREPC